MIILNLFDICFIHLFGCVSASNNIRNNDVNFEHLIEHALSYTLERKDEDVSSVNELRLERSMRCSM